MDNPNHVIQKYKMRSFETVKPITIKTYLQNIHDNSDCLATPPIFSEELLHKMVALSSNYDRYDVETYQNIGADYHTSHG